MMASSWNITDMKTALLKNRKSLFQETVFLGVVFFASLFFCQLRMRYADFFASPEMFEEITNHVGHKPWQYRILIPGMANFFHGLGLPFVNTLWGWGRVMELMFLCLSVVAFRGYLNLFVKNRSVASLMSFSLFFILPFQYFFPRPYYANYWYDTPSIFFFTLGLTLLYQRKWAFYYVLFAVATLNRETTCFLTVIYLFTAIGRERIVTIGAHCAAQFIIWMAIKTVLAQVFVGNSGADGFEWYDGTGLTHYADNLRFFMSPMNYPAFFSNFGFLWIPVLLYYKRIPNEFVRRSLWVIIPFFAGMFLVANIYELRLFVELVPLVLTPFFLIVIDLLKTSGRNPEDVA
jgi:hypothetical protein